MINRVLILLALSIILAPTTFAQKPWFIEPYIGVGTLFQQQEGNADFEEWGVDLASNTVPSLGVSFSVPVMEGHYFFAGYRWSHLAQTLTYGPARPIMGDGLSTLRGKVSIFSLHSFQIGYQIRTSLPLNLGQIGAGIGGVFSRDNSKVYRNPSELPIITGAGLGSDIGEYLITEEVIRLQDLGLTATLRWYFPSKDGGWQWFMGAEYQHYFRPWNRLTTDYFYIYQWPDPNTVVAEPSFTATTYLRNLTVQSGISIMLNRTHSPTEIGKERLQF